VRSPRYRVRVCSEAESHELIEAKTGRRLEPLHSGWFGDVFHGALRVDRPQLLVADHLGHRVIHGVEIPVLHKPHLKPAGSVAKAIF